MLHNELRKLRPFASLCCGVITLAVIGLIFIVQMNATARAGQTSSWSKCTGTVNATYKEKDNSTYVCYDYEVSGKKYIEQRIYFDQLASGAHIADNDSYHVGQTVPVFYNPQKPEEAVLRTGPEQHRNDFWKYAPALLLGFGLLFLGLKKFSRPLG